MAWHTIKEAIDDDADVDIDVRNMNIDVRTILFITLTCQRILMSVISSLLHSHVNLEWCDTIKLSNPLLPRKSGTIKSLQLLSTSETLSPKIYITAWYKIERGRPAPWDKGR